MNFKSFFLIALVLVAGQAYGDPSWSKSLPLQTFRQEQSQWCGAANSQMVRTFYKSKYWEEVQCWMADRNSQTPLYFCCNPTRGAMPICNQPRWPHVWAADDINWTLKDGLIDFGTASGEISANRPVVLYVAWNGGGAHVITMYGASMAGGGASKSLTVYDPGSNDTKVLNYTTLPTYGSGKITKYYLTSRKL